MEVVPKVDKYMLAPAVITTYHQVRGWLIDQ